MKPYLFKHLAGAALALACGAASAQLGNGGGTYAGVDKVNTNPVQIVSAFVGITKTVLAGDAGMLGALGLKEQAGKAGAAAAALEAGPSRSQIEDVLKLQADNSQALEAKMAGKAELSDAAKQEFGSGVADLASGMMQYAAMSKDLFDLKKTVRPIGGPASSALYVSKSLPGSVKELGQTLKAAVAFAKANNISLPQQVNDALALL